MVKEVIGQLTKLSDIRDSLNQIETLNQKEFNFHISSKIVFEEGQDIFRISSLINMAKRLLIIKLFESQGSQLFLPEEVVYFDSFCGVSKQRKLTKLCNYSDREIFDTLSRKEKEIIEKYGFLWYGKGNSGFSDKGEIKIFDYIANLSVKQIKKTFKFILIDKGGNELVEINLQSFR